MTDLNFMFFSKRTEDFPKEKKNTLSWFEN